MVLVIGVVIEANKSGLFLHKSSHITEFNTAIWCDWRENMFKYMDTVEIIIW